MPLEVPPLMTADSMIRDVTVRCPDGLHLRPADRLVRLANQFESTVSIRSDGQWMDCKSILSLLTLGAASGDQLQITAEGNDAESALGEIVQWFENGSLEDEADDEPQEADAT